MTSRWITAALLLLASPLVGQEQEPVLYVGARVRVTAPTVSQKRLVGTYWRVQEDSTLQMEAEKPEQILHIPLADIEEIAVSLGRKSGAGKGALIGGGVGFALGAAAGVALCESPPTVGIGGSSEPCGEPVLAGLAGGALAPSLREIAEELGVGHDTVKSWSVGRRSPSPSRLRKLIELLEGQAGELQRHAEALKAALEGGRNDG